MLAWHLAPGFLACGAATQPGEFCRCKIECGVPFHLYIGVAAAAVIGAGAVVQPAFSDQRLREARWMRQRGWDVPQDRGGVGIILEWLNDKCVTAVTLGCCFVHGDLPLIFACPGAACHRLTKIGLTVECQYLYKL